MESKKPRRWPSSPTASPPAAASTCAASTTRYRSRSPASASPPPPPASRRGPPPPALTLPRAPPRSTLRTTSPIPSPRHPWGGARRCCSRWPPWADAEAPTAAARLRPMAAAPRGAPGLSLTTAQPLRPPYAAPVAAKAATAARTAESAATVVTMTHPRSSRHGRKKKSKRGYQPEEISRSFVLRHETSGYRLPGTLLCWIGELTDPIEDLQDSSTRPHQQD